MYCNFYGFSERPFEVTPDPRFLYQSPGHKEVLASLIYGIRERRGFIAIVGEVGTGKTTLLKALLERLDGDTKVGFIFNTDVTFKEMLKLAIVDLGLATSKENLTKMDAIERLNEFAIEQIGRGNNVAIIVDEAQNLDRRSMENLRLISNLETHKHKLIQIVLSGQPELDFKLSQPELRQLAQRISLKRYVTPLSEKETYEYIRHRLTVANCRDRKMFSLRANQLIWEYSGGVPRKINILCDNALLIGYGLQQKRIDGHVLEEAIKDLSWSPFLDTSAHNTVPDENEIKAPMEERPNYKEITKEIIKRHSRIILNWFASTRHIAITACIVFILGILVGVTWLRPRTEQSVKPDNVSHTKTIVQPGASSESMAGYPISTNGEVANASEIAPANGRKETTGLAAATAPQEPVDTAPVQDKVVTAQKNDGAVLAPQHDSKNPESTQGAEDRKSWKSVSVKTGDIFSKLVAGVYGRATEDNLRLVRMYNPHIKDIDKIEVGDRIIFPPPYTTE